MDAVLNSVLDMLQAVTLPQTGKSQSKDGQSGEPFAKLMDQQRQLQQDTGATADTQEKTEAPAVSEAPKAETDDNAEAAAGQMQMAWAALAMANPPVQAEMTAEAAEAAPAVVEAIADVTVDVEADSDAPVLETLPETAEAVEAPADVEAPAETAETPEAPQAEAPRAETVETGRAPERAQVQRTEAPEDDAEFTVEEAVTAPQPLFADSEAIPVKVGEAELPQQESEPVDHQLSKPILDAMQQGESRVAVQLTPENLGSVTVEITRSGDGTLHVTLSAERVQTQGLLEKHMGGLQAMLAARNQDTVRVEVQRREESSAYQPYDGRNGHNQQQRQQERQQRQENHGGDFMQQLRLGLIPMDED